MVLSMSLDLSKKLKHYRLSLAEYEKMKSLLGREPLPVEWPLFSALWSEHCSYKSSKVHLRKFAKTLNNRVLNSLGENAGVVDLGEGERIVFKMESHNHPSFIEPYQGAATGVGGILRDIFTMGARPIALADYLCFGSLASEGETSLRGCSKEFRQLKFLVDGVVRGISGYGNSVGVPTVTGQTCFDPAYNKNILVNALAVGLLKQDEKVALSAAKGPGNLVVYVGAKTGKDGVHGAAMASESFDENSEDKKPNVQIGDPYFEKLLIESCLDVLQRNLVVAIQDMGAAGLTSSSFEMASKGNVGMSLNLDQVPVRDSSITPEEILLSETQERMLLICKVHDFQELKSCFERWGLDAVAIGEVIEERQVKLWWKGNLLTSIDPHLLVEEAPVYERPYQSWNLQEKANRTSKKESLRPKAHSVQSLSQPSFSSRREIYRQYDQRVGLRTIRGAEHDVALLKLDSGRVLGVALGGRPHLMKIDAKIGALDGVFYPSIQMALKGIRILALTDCLNFGNPERQDIMSEFVASITSIVEASQALKAPVISGNVSFYNETLGENIISTPAIGVVGLGSNPWPFPEDCFQGAGNGVYQISSHQVFLDENSFFLLGDGQGPNLQINLKVWTQFVDDLIELTQASSMIVSSQVIGRGGLGMCLAKMSTATMGYKSCIQLDSRQMWQEVLYGSVVEVKAAHQGEFEKFCGTRELSYLKIGEVRSCLFELNDGTSWEWDQLKKEYQKGLECFIENLA